MEEKPTFNYKSSRMKPSSAYKTVLLLKAKMAFLNP
jgi:hypothetical protein